MSAEVAKKRGRPKKVISDPVEVGVEITESAKKKVGTTRAKSTKTAAKVTKAAKGDGVKKSVVKAGGASAGLKSVPKVGEAPGKSGVKEGGKVVGAKSTPATPATTTRPSTTTAATTTSKILEQVKEMEARKEGVSQESAKGTTAAVGKGLTPEAAKEVERSQQELATKESKSRATAKPNPVPSQQKPSSSSKAPDPKIAAKQPPPPQPPVGKATPPPSPPPSAKPTPAPTPKPIPTTKPHVPLAQLNSTIVSNITTRAGARPNTPGSQQLPKNYKPVARKVTMAIVALPILIVTSYVLYQRLVLGEEKKMLVQPQQNPVRGEVKKAVPPSTSSAESS